MGAYDTITCDYQLPDAEAQSLAFQTTSLSCTFTVYRITSDGRLTWRETIERRNVMGTFRRPTGNLLDMDYTGEVEMFGTVYDPDVSGIHTLVEWAALSDMGKVRDYGYRLLFVRGVVVWVERIDLWGKVTTELDT